MVFCSVPTWGRDSVPLVRGYIRFRSDWRFKASRDWKRFNGSYRVSRALARFGRAERRPESGSGSGAPQSSRSASVRSGYPVAPGKNSYRARARILPLKEETPLFRSDSQWPRSRRRRTGKQPIGRENAKAFDQSESDKWNAIPLKSNPLGYRKR